MFHRCIVRRIFATMLAPRLGHQRGRARTRRAAGGMTSHHNMQVFYVGKIGDFRLVKSPQKLGDLLKTWPKQICVGDDISPRVGWCSIRIFTNPCQPKMLVFLQEWRFSPKHSWEIFQWFQWFPTLGGGRLQSNMINKVLDPAESSTNSTKWPQIADQRWICLKSGSTPNVLSCFIPILWWQTDRGDSQYEPIFGHMDSVDFTSQYHMVKYMVQ